MQSDNLEKMVRDKNLDARVGYLLWWQIYPFYHGGRDDLELKLYRQPIKESHSPKNEKERAGYYWARNCGCL